MGATQGRRLTLAHMVSKTWTWFTRRAISHWQLILFKNWAVNSEDQHGRSVEGASLSHPISPPQKTKTNGETTFTNKVFTFNNNGAIRWNLTPLAAFLPSLKSMSCSFPRPLLIDKKIHLNSHPKKELNVERQASLQRAIENLFKKLNANI